MNKEKKKVFVGISGGVDSSVSAYLLKQQGYDVHGIFVKTWSPEWLPCTWIDEKRDAMRICAALDIPFHFLDAEETYKTSVADYMISEYKSGRTPNPDVLCNREIKFGVMWEYAKAHGAAALATGHYAQTDGIHLKKGIDPGKDQSYFLWMVTKKELPHILFPIGHLQKKEVRHIAESIRLFTATKKDSQGICFLGDVDMKAFLKHYIDEKPGPVVTKEGKEVGIHEGVWFYTLGERHGFTITEATDMRQPYYVVGKDIEHNKIIVSHSVKTDHFNEGMQKIILRSSNWFTDPIGTKTYTAQIRYHSTLLPVTIVGDVLTLHSNEPVALGQSLVVYDDDTVIGGGIIDEIK